MTRREIAQTIVVVTVLLTILIGEAFLDNAWGAIEDDARKSCAADVGRVPEEVYVEWEWSSFGFECYEMRG